MKNTRTVGAGISLFSSTMPNGALTRGIVVDNGTGGWLYIQEANDFVPPYTLQWSRDLDYAASAITILYGLAPAGQISTSLGTNYSLTQYDVPIGASNGVPDKFIEQFNPMQKAGVDVVVNAGDAANTFSFTTNVTGGNKRIRLHGCILTCIGVAQTGMICPTPVFGQFDIQNPITQLRVAGYKIHDERFYNPYVDLAIGHEVQVSVRNVTTAFIDGAFAPGFIGFGIDVVANIVFEVV